MADNDLVVAILRDIQNRLGRLEEAVRDLTRRTGRMERTLADVAGGQADESVRIDRLAERIDRIERRLEISETSPPPA